MRVTLPGETHAPVFEVTVSDDTQMDFLFRHRGEVIWKKRVVSPKTAKKGNADHRLELPRHVHERGYDEILVYWARYSRRPCRLVRLVPQG